MSLIASLKKNQKSAKLDFGIHTSIALRKVDISERTSATGPSSLFLFLNFVKVVDNTVVGEFEASWFKLKNTDERPFENLREMCVQVDALLQCYYTEDEIDVVMKDLFTDNAWTTVKEIEEAKMTSEALKTFMKNFQEKVYTLLSVKTGQTQEDAILRLKLCLNKKGDNVQIPMFGAFVENSNVPEEATKLYFSSYEKKNNSKQGNVSSATTISNSMSNI